MKLEIVALALIGSMSLCAADAAAPAAQPAAQPAATAAVAAQPAAQPAATATVAAQPAAQQPATVVVVEQPKHESPGMGFCLARGFCNVLTGWLEIPRCMVYDNSAIPFLGLIIGIPEGAIYTVVRELAGVFDIITFGCTGDGMYNEVFGDTVFDSNWLPPAK